MNEKLYPKSSIEECFEFIESELQGLSKFEKHLLRVGAFAVANQIVLSQATSDLEHFKKIITDAAKPLRVAELKRGNAKPQSNVH
jgi:hypothetical protein